MKLKLNRVRSLLTALLALPGIAGTSPALRADVVTDWNNVAVPLLRKTPNIVATRNLALVHVAMFDAANAVAGKYAPYSFNVAAPTASAEAAVAQSAHDLLLRLFPAEQAALDTALVTSLAALPDGAAKTSGVLLGGTVATQLWNLRLSDGSTLSVSNAFPGGPGLYLPTPGGPAAPVSQQYAYVTPWVLRSASQFRPGPPPALTSTQWAADFNEIKSLGATNSATRTPEQTDIALFCIDLPHYLLNSAAQQAILAHPLSVVDSARVFALMHLADADAGLAVWDGKYAYNFWRPVTAARAADTDGNDATSPDPDWLPLRATPGHPEYPCAHCTISGAMCGVLAAIFGDDFTFTLESTTLPGKPRTFHKFSEYAALSLEGRLYAGFHFRNSSEVGLTLGRDVGAYVVNNCLVAGAPLAAALNAGEFHLSTQSRGDLQQQLEVSADLVNWSPLTTFTRTDTSLQLIDTTPGAGHQFYRAVAP